MRHLICLGVIAAATLSAASETTPIAVCIGGPPIDVRTGQRARLVASRIYAKIGVELKWQLCGKNVRNAIHVQLMGTAPKGLAPTVLGDALPYEGQTVKVYFDQILEVTHDFQGDVLGHVMAHEIAHVLQGIARHSDQGVMKPNWSVQERMRMVMAPLEFADEDALLINEGIRMRSQQALPRGAVGK